ncbi:MAG: isoleucine--tRNA ligase [Dehalococcoidia bacterium]
MFREVKTKVNFPQLEEDILRFWKEHDIFGQSIKLREGCPRYVFYEGPPTANGSPAVHHVLARVYKDAVCRYTTMKGYHVPRKAGWDTHGLPVELEVEKSLALASKAQIEEYGVARFNERCRQSVLKYIDEWQAMTERLGYWLDMKHPYITLDNRYVESCWWIIKQLWDKDLIYQGYKVTPHCPRCGTTISSHEVAQGYKEADDPSVYIKFRVEADSLDRDNRLRTVLASFGALRKPVFLLAWTTTPWTLPGNTALAVAPHAAYSVMESGEDCLIMAAMLVDEVGLEGYEQVGVVPGDVLEHLEYEPLFNPHHFGVQLLALPTLALGESREGLTYPVVGADFVSLDEGTGVVHIAPAFGEIDFDLGMDSGLGFVQPVDLQGRVLGTYPFAGKFVKDADPEILDDLSRRGLVYRSGKITHTYPFCWRCETPLLYYAKRAWYIRTTAMKEELISGNAEINWHPEHIKHGRFGDWLENNIDWAFSRERYWGTPLNIWQCSSCDRYECVGSVDELKGQAGPGGLDRPLDLHRPYVDEITFACPGCGGKMQRVSEIADCWFDSGAMPVAQWHYPFENEGTFQQNHPADFICEAVDQTRGWFYSLHALSTLLFDRPCFRNAICLGFVVDSQGEKMSTSRGNVVDPWTVFNSYGADALRWYMLSATTGDDNRRFSAKMVEETVRKFLLTLWNTYSFFTLYANIDCFVPPSMRVGSDHPTAFTDLDRWISSELNRLASEVSELMDDYNLTAATRRIEGFVDNLSNWYVRRNRRRFWKGENDADKLAGYTTLYQCLVTLSKLLAPFAPFIAEELYQNLVRSVDAGAAESVHLTDFPVADKSRINDELNRSAEVAMKISSLGRAARAKAGIKVRQPLSEAVVWVKTEGEKQGLESLAAEVKEEVNVRQLVVLSEADNPDGAGCYEDMPDYAVADDGKYWVAMKTELSPELVAEGISRELVRHLQNMRRNARFDVTDHIITYYQAEEALVRQVIDAFAAYIRQETLSHEIINGAPPDGAYGERHRISNSEVYLAVRRVSSA